jgi:DnaJ-class molecular chaperone
MRAVTRLGRRLASPQLAANLSRLGAPPMLRAAGAASQLGGGSTSRQGPRPQLPLGARLMSSNKPDYYDSLGVPKGASKSEIKKGYYNLAKKYHPDTNDGDPAAAKKFAELSEAYEVLGDDEKKKVYDTYGHAGLNGGGGGGAHGFGFQGGFGGGSPEDIFAAFEQAFGGRMNFGGRPRGPSRGRDVQVELGLDLFEAANGVKKTVQWRSPSAGMRSLEVNIPAGVDSGMNLRVASEGEPGEAGPGHLYITMSVAEHPVFERDGNDVHVKVRLTIAEAVLGAKVMIPTLKGPVSLKTPAGTQSGDRRVMAGRGLQNPQRGTAGHQYVEITAGL